MTGYNIKVAMYEQVGLGIRVTYRKARKETKLGTSRLKFFLSKEVIPYPTGDMFFPIGKKTSMINFYKDKNGAYHPLKLRFDEEKNPFLVPDNSDMSFWYANQLREAEQAYRQQSTFEKYAPIIVFGGVICFAALILILYGKWYFDGVQASANALSGSMGSLEQSLKTIGGI